jgi:cellulose synthase (UDP-forming)
MREADLGMPDEVVMHSTDAGESASAADAFPILDETPLLPRWRERLLHVFAVVTLSYSAYYLFWRWTATLNPDALWISIPLAAAETLSILLLTLTVYNVWRLPRIVPQKARPGLSVDVYITTYDEPVDVIRKTAIGAKAITYPHRTYILDDGRNTELAQMAHELGIGYITREDNRNAKAGNLNNALAQTNGEFILQLDADHVPLPYILDRLLGYMNDPRIAFVQAPQNFYNNEAFGTHLNRETGRLLTDQNIFFFAIQPGKSRLNAAFFCGSCAVLRRTAIDEIGGIASRTITEDIESSLLMHARGWKSAYHNETLAYGLAPRTFAGFGVQRSRWAKGGMQMLRKYNPLTIPGLTIPQRLSYLAANLHALEGLVRLVFMMAPLIFLLTGVYAVRAYGPDFFAHFIPFVVLTLLLHQLVARGRSGPLWFVEMITTAKAFAHASSLLAYFTNKQLRFLVTPKGLENVAWRAHLPFMVILGLSLAALVRGGWVFTSDLLRWGVQDADTLAFSLNVTWAGWNTVILVMVLRACIDSLQRRPMQRFDEFLPFRLRVLRDDGTEGAWITAITENMHEAGLAFRSLEDVPLGTQVRLVLPLAHDEISLTGRVVHQREAPVGQVVFRRHGVMFDDPPQAIKDAISLHCTHHAVPGMRHRYVEELDPFTEAARWLRDPRTDRRERILLPIYVNSSTDGGPVWRSLAILEDTSKGGARVMLEAAVQPGDTLSYEVPGTAIRGSGRVVHCARIATPLGDRWVAGVLHDPATTDPMLIPTRISGLRHIRKVAMIAGIITTLKRFSFVLVLTGVALAARADATAAQTGWLAGVEAAEDGQSLMLLGGWIGGTQGPWRPAAGFVAYRLAYDGSLGSSVDVWTANPWVGVRRQWGPNGVQASVGWAFQSEEAIAGLRRVSSGLTTAVHLDRGGNVATTAQLLASYSWGDDGYFWSRGRVAQKVMGDEVPRLRVGAEGTAQGGGGYRAYEIGPMVQWTPPGIASFVASAGYRRGDPDPGNASSTGFLRAEMVIIP